MPIPVLTSTLPVRLLAACVLCALLMANLMSPLFAAPRGDAFPRLSDNLAASPGFEVRRQINGHVRAMFALPERREVIVSADGYLWRFSADGHLLDTLDEPGDMHRNGIAFGEHDFVDWIHTGERRRKPYAAPVDGNGLDQAELHAALSAARAVAFGRQGEQAWAWLWDGESAWRMDISAHHARVDTYCTPRSSTEATVSWGDTCLEGLATAAPLMVEIRPGPFVDTGGGRTARVEVAGFKRRHHHFEGGMLGYAGGTVVGGVIKAIAPHIPGEPPRRYWFGDARVRLHLEGEVLQFTVFVGRDAGDYEFRHMLDWWDPSGVIPGASPWLRVRMRDYIDHAGEDALWEMYRPDFGLYAVRPRHGAHALPAPARPVPAWRPAFEAPVTPRSAVTGHLELEGGTRVHRWWRAKPPRPRIAAPPVALDADGPPLQALPLAMQVAWGSPWDADAHSVLEVALDAAETRAAFARLPRGKEPASLLLQVPDLFGEVDGMRVLLRRGGGEVALERARLAYLQRPPFRPWRPREGEPRPPSRVQQLHASADAVLAGRPDALARLRAQAGALAQDPDMAEAAAPFVTAAYARLMGELNLAGRAEDSLALARHYLAEVYPYTAAHTGDPSTAYNTSVIASQALAVGVHRPGHAALVEAVIATLVGEGFDPDAHANATLLYNLACYHALRGDRAQVLRHVAAAARGGKPAGQFRRDPDFAAYRDDPAFEAAITGGQGG